MHPKVREALLSFFQSPGLLAGNPSSVHRFGRPLKKIYRESLESIAAAIDPGLQPKQLVLTSSGTEALQAAVRSEWERAHRERSPFHWITTLGEHEAHGRMVEWVERQGGKVTRLGTDANGYPDFAPLDSVLDPQEHTLLSLIWVNNETGVITPLEPAIARARSKGVRVSIDGAQAWGKIKTPILALGVDYASFAGHKIGALAGMGVLYLKEPQAFEALIRGRQQSSLRGGTENMVGVLALGVAARQVNPARFYEITAPLQKDFESECLQALPGACINGAGAERVTNTTNLMLSGCRAGFLIPQLDLAGYAVSAGSACSSESPEPSRVLTAMGLSREKALCSIRVSFGASTQPQELSGLLRELTRITARNREEARR